jgi:hypothetical protein
LSPAIALASSSNLFCRFACLALAAFIAAFVSTTFSGRLRGAWGVAAPPNADNMRARVLITTY